MDLGPPVAATHLLQQALARRTMPCHATPTVKFTHTPGRSDQIAVIRPTIRIDHPLQA